jgi:hypothetical protein
MVMGGLDNLYSLIASFIIQSGEENPLKYSHRWGAEEPLNEHNQK